MIHPALYKLIGLQFGAAGRRMIRGARSPGRVLVFLLGGVICILWLFSTLLTLRHRSDPNWIRAIMPLALLGICFMTAITSAGDKAIAFTPGEVDQLFPGPFTRRELLGYKLIKSTLAAVLTALVLSVAMFRHARWWPACFFGVFMSLLFVQWFSIALLLGGQAIGTSAHTRIRKFVLLGAGIVFIVGARPWFAAGLHSGKAAVYQFRVSPIGHALLAPLDPFGELMTAANALTTLKFAFVTAIINGALLSIVFMLDAHYVETAIAASERRYAKLQRVRAGSFLSMGVGKTSQWHLPRLPWLFGAGPIAWRQLTTAARSSRGLLMLLAIVAVGAAPALANVGPGMNVIQLLLGVMAWLTFLCSSMFSFDFRGDIDHIEAIKALPLRGWAVTIGQLVAPVLLLTIFHFLLLGIAAATIHSRRDILLAAIALALPFNTILFEAENLVFLLFPSRPAAVSPGDFQVLGRKFIFLLGRMLVVATACIVALIPAGLTYILTGGRLRAATAVCWLFLAAEGAILVPVIAIAFRRFDPSIDTPA
ncbi:MAG TPA: putative ABC exporter domain-containing protein [Tepidisphaeraceae bacterium]|jgi:hypothetical protein|nr:putative ABC exporter domain-containing protein [Tepidisphaeraceae bacterium]